MAALLGRETELAAIDALLARAEEGRGGALMLLGPAGIGKSALAREAMRCAAVRAFDVAAGAAWELGEAPPLFALRPCLSGITTECNDFELWERTAATLAARARPQLWVVEDLHAADARSIELLCFLARVLHGMRVALVLTARHDDPRGGARVVELLTRLRRDAETLHPAPLTRTEIAQLLSTNDTAAAQVEAWTGGNPLFVGECARLLAQSGALDGLPRTLAHVVLAHLQQTPPTTLALVKSASVLGRHFDAQRLARMHKSLPARVIDDLAPALRAQWVTELGPGRFQFRHALVCDAVYQALGTDERLALHGLAVNAVDTPIEKADHALHAADPVLALPLADSAIALCTSQGAHDRAYALAKRRHALWSLHHPVEAASLLALARFSYAAGLPDTWHLCEEAYTLAAGDGDLMAEAALLRGAELQPSTVDRRLVELLEGALLRVRDPRLRVRLEARLAAAIQPALDPSVPIAKAAAALTAARALGDDATLLDVLFWAGSAYVDLSPLAERMASARELRDRALQAGDLPRAIHAYQRLMMDEAQNGDFAAFSRDLAELYVLSRQGVHPRFRWRSLLFESMSALMHGDFAQSERVLVELDQLAPLCDAPALPMSRYAHAFHRMRILHDDDGLCAQLGDLTRALGALPAGDGLAAIFRAWTYTWLEDAATAARELHACPPLHPAFRYDTFFFGLAAETIAFVGTPEQAKDKLDQLLARDPFDLVSGAVPYTYEGPSLRLRGLLEARSGDTTAAKATLEMAEAHCRRHKLWPWVARVGYERARIDPAMDTAQTRALAEKLGMTGLCTRLDRLRGRAPAPIETSQAAFTLARDGDVWLVGYAGKRIRVKDNRGMQLLMRLVERPGQELHVLALSNDDGTSLQDSDAGEALDARALAEYRARLEEDDISESERAFLQAELDRASGYGGRVRRLASQSERARINVQRRLKDAFKRIHEHDANAAKYLEKAVRTGTFCSYRP